MMLRCIAIYLAICKIVMLVSISFIATYVLQLSDVFT